MTKLHRIISLKEEPNLAVPASKMLHYKWGFPEDEYLAFINAYLKGETILSWYVCLWKHEIVGLVGIIPCDYNERTDLTPSVCGLSVKRDHRGKGIEEALLDCVLKDMQKYGISPIYAFSKYTSNIYQQPELGWKEYCETTSDLGDKGTIYIHK